MLDQPYETKDSYLDIDINNNKDRLTVSVTDGDNKPIDDVLLPL